MNNEYFEKAIKFHGTGAALARSLGVVPMVVSGWRTRGIPGGRVLDIARSVGWSVTPHQLAPDLYPHPDDGLPVELRSSCKEAA